MPYVALDLGERRIGVAVSDPSGSMAFPHSVLERTNIKADIEKIVALALEYPDAEIVVGYPLTLRGEHGPATEKTDAFVTALRRRFTGTVHLCDERMTTALATRSLIAADLSRRKRKSVVDQVAAANILETFLMRRRRESSS